MIQAYYNQVYGKFNIKGITIKIYASNCLCAMCYDYTDEHDKKMRALYMFYNDEQHIKNIIKNMGSLFGEKVTGASLNLYYKESNILLKYFVREGIKVNCYYKEPKNKK